jgi:hypothetical protein
MKTRQSIFKFLKTPSDARSLYLVALVVLGSGICIWSLIPKPYSGQSPQELCEYVRESTRERLKWSPPPYTDPLTNNEKIEARWKLFTEKIPDKGATLIASRARNAFSSRAWPVDVFWGKVNGKGVWIILATGDAYTAKAPQARLVLKNGLSAGRGPSPIVDPTEIAIIDAEAPFILLFHDGRRKLI